MPQVEKTVLANGLTVITDHNPAAPLLYANIVFRAGSLSDFVRPGSNSRRGEVERVVLNGLAHFTEHVIPHGHKELGLSGINALQEDYGFTPETANFETGDNNTSFYAHGAPANVKALLPVYAELLSDAQPTDEALRLERPRIMDEMATQWQTQDRLARKWFWDSFYEAGSSPTQFVGGKPETLANIELADIAAFVRDNYTSDNCAFITSGNMSHEDAIAFAETHLATLPRGRRNTPILPERNRGDIAQRNFYKTENVDINLYFPLPGMTLNELGQAQLLSKYVKNALRDVSDQFGIYGIPVSVGYGRSDDLYLNITASCKPERAAAITAAIAERLARAYNELEPESFDLLQKRMQLMAENGNAVSASSAGDRGRRLTFNFAKDEPLLADFYDTAGIRAATFPATKAQLGAMLVSVPTTYHYGPERSDYMKGADIATHIARRIPANDQNNSPANDFGAYHPDEFNARPAGQGSGQLQAQPYSPSRQP